MTNEDTDALIVQDVIGVLSKYEGEELPENEYERVSVDMSRGQIIKIEQIENGEVVSTQEVTELPTD